MAKLRNFAFLNPGNIKKLAASISLAVLLNILVKPLWLYVEGLVQNHLGHADFGLFSALFALCFVLTAFADLGLNQFATREISQGRNFLSDNFPTLFGIKLLVLAIFPVLLIGAGWLIGYDAGKLTLLFWIAAGVSFLQLLQLFRAVLQAQQRFNTDSIISVLDKGLLIGLLLALLATSFSLEGYVFARLGITALVVLIAYLLVVKRAGWLKPGFQKARVMPLLRGSLPFAVMTLVYGLNEKIDMVLLERLYSASEAGLYAASYRWVDAVMMYVWTVLPIFFAKFAGLQNQKTEQRELMAFGQVIVAVPIVFICFVVFFHGGNLFWFLTRSTPAEIALMTRNLQILFAAVLLHGVAAIYSTLLTATGREKQVSWVVGAGIALNIGLNLVFIPTFGSEAAAWSTVASAVFMSAGYIILLVKSGAYSVPYGIALRLLVFIFISGVVHYLLGLAPLHWILASAASGVLMLALVPLLGLVNVRTLLKRP
ncbi:MAG: hypothetical protein EOO68_20185 [Moraxellaceae bacterium]|nr:MAG: hypothetical protein EOO68_20185 [Moraxellaceae bacterium]